MKGDRRYGRRRGMAMPANHGIKSPKMPENLPFYIEHSSAGIIVGLNCQVAVPITCTIADAQRLIWEALCSGSRWPDDRIEDVKEHITDGVKKWGREINP